MTMSKKFVLDGVLRPAGCVLSAALLHPLGIFDNIKTLHVHGATVRKFRWTNPYSFVVVDVKDAKGTTSYTLECNSINLMSRAGWKVNTLKVGYKVTLDYYPLRDGKPGGMLKTI